MPVEQISYLEQATDAIKYLVMLLVGLLGYNLRDAKKQLNDHAVNHVRKEELDRLNDSIKAGFDTLRSEVKTMTTQNRIDLRDLTKRVDRFNDK